MYGTKSSWLLIFSIVLFSVVQYGTSANKEDIHGGVPMGVINNKCDNASVSLNFIQKLCLSFWNSMQEKLFWSRNLLECLLLICSWINAIAFILSIEMNNCNGRLYGNFMIQVLFVTLCWTPFHSQNLPFSLFLISFQIDNLAHYNKW